MWSHGIVMALQIVITLMMMTKNLASGHFLTDVSGHYLTIEIRRTQLNCDDTWTAMSDRTLAYASSRVEAACSITSRRQAIRGQTALFHGASI